MNAALSGLARLVRPVVGGIAAGGVVVGLALGGHFDTLESWVLSGLYELRGPRPVTAPVVIVAIDDASIGDIGKWPFPRAVHGELLQKIAQAKPLAIGIDVVFDGPSPRGADDDVVLSDSIFVAGNVVLASLVIEGPQGVIRREPNAVVRKSAAAVAPVNLIHDRDGYVRRSMLAVRAAGEDVPAFDVALYRLATKAGLPAAPLPAGPTVHINYRGGPRTYPWVPFSRVIRGETEPSVFRDRIVLVGRTTEALYDVFAAPFVSRPEMPGVEIHANVLDTYITGNALREVPWWASLVLAGVASVIGSAVAARFSAVRGFVLTALVWVALAAAAAACFAFADVWLPAMASSVALVLGYGATTVEGSIARQRDGRRLSRHFRADVLGRVGRSNESLAPTRRVVTVLFCDVRGFTALADTLPADQIAAILEDYLTEMTEIVFRYNGTLDKYVGDSVMALYNAPFDDPEHAANAVRTAIELQERTLAVSQKWEEKLGVQIRNSVGINTGEAVVGALGSKQRVEYTALGDTINLGARVASVTRDYGASVIISETTYALLKPGQFLTRELGAVTVKGKTQPVRIYSVVSLNTRKFPRVPIDAEAHISGAGVECAARVIDISEAGLELGRLPEGWKAGTLVNVRCESGDLPKAFEARGKLAWVHGDRAGVEFTMIAPHARELLAAYVAERLR